MTTPEEIRLLERAARSSWPALQEVSLRGWILGWSGAYTRRANCVSPFESPEAHSAPLPPLAARVEEVEAHYAARGRNAVFKLTAAAQPKELDAFLAGRGYGRHSETLVMRLPGPAAPAVSRPAAGDEGTNAGKERFELAEGRPSRDWFDASCAFSNVPDEMRSDYEGILERLRIKGGDCFFGAWSVAGMIRSVALGVTCDGITSFHQVATQSDVRGRRYAERVVRALLSTTADRGAASAMLSVEADNASARRLYDRLGFGEAYRYWYRER